MNTLRVFVRRPDGRIARLDKQPESALRVADHGKESQRLVYVGDGEPAQEIEAVFSIPDGADDLLRRAREELFHAKVVVRRERNSAKTSAAALDDSEKRIDGLISEIQAELNGSPDQEVQGHDEDAARTRHYLAEARH